MVKNKLKLDNDSSVSPKASLEKVGNAELLILIEQNSALIEENLRLTKRLHAHMIFAQAMFWVKFLLVVISLALAFNYLPPMFGNLLGAYQRLQPNSVVRCLEDQSVKQPEVPVKAPVVMPVVIPTVTSTIATTTTN